MMYRYVTIEVSRRGKNQADVEKIKQNPPPPADGSSQDNSDDSEDRIEEAIDKLPYSEIVESGKMVYLLCCF